VVNVVGITGEDGGWVSINDLEERGAFQTYAFSINSATSNETSDAFGSPTNLFTSR
jgi:hypothetical protein